MIAADPRRAFEDFRADYDRMGFRSQVAFYQWVATMFPAQASFDATACRMFLDATKPSSVCEVGGWDGGLAATVLPNASFVTSWDNHDLVHVPQVCFDRRYHQRVLKDWFWKVAPQADALVASHVVEHLSVPHVEALLDCLTGYRCVFLTVPIPETEKPDWRGYHGSHVLPLSWAELRGLLATRGWTETGRLGESSWFARADR